MKSKKLRVLIADDQPGVRYLLDIVVKECGHKTYLAQNGLEAVGIARAKNPDLVFMDVRMPLNGGLEALGEIKETNPGVEVIIMTAYGSEQTISNALEKGAWRYLAKPFDVDEIKEILIDFINEYGDERSEVAGLQ